MDAMGSGWGRTCAAAVILGALAADAGGAATPFSVSAALETLADGEAVLNVAFAVPPDHSLYADAITVAAPAGVTLVPALIPAPVRKHDPTSGADRDVYTNDFRFVYRLTGSAGAGLDITVGWQGCSPTVCFMPAETRIALAPAAANAAGLSPPAGMPVGRGPPERSAAMADWRRRMDGFAVAGRQAGYLGPETFLRFLDAAESGGGSADNRLRAMFSSRGAWAWLAALLIVLGGAGLNLTPCVLPMIPINLAILGAGARAGSRSRGFMLGAVYGLAMAMAYGLLGLAVVLTGSKFGMLNSSPVFNAIVALIFVALALAVFDVFTLDLSRFHGGRPPPSGARHALLTAFVMGAVAALLAGSCVAPILISVLLLSADLCKRGEVLGVALPFLLGLGMGLPWPFLGAGLAFLPPPGKWMLAVKRVFGVIVLGVAVYYAQLAYRLFRDRDPQHRARVEAAQAAGLEQAWFARLSDALAAAQKDNRPVFVDFWADWCKNCLAMDETTFRDPRVAERLAGYVKVKCRADNLGDPDVKAMLDYFGAIGLPTYVILKPTAAFWIHD